MMLGNCIPYVIQDVEWMVGGFFVYVSGVLREELFCSKSRYHDDCVT